MQFKSRSCPEPSKGQAGGRKRQVVPNQAMSLGEILQRFVRHEPLPVGKEGVYHEGEDDLSKLDVMDPTEKKEYADRLRQTQREYKEQQRIKRVKLENEERAKIAAKLAADIAAKAAAEKKAE